MSALDKLAAGIEEQAAMIRWSIGAWQDLGYAEPLPFPTAHPIPPLGERTAEDIKAGHRAIEDIDGLMRQLHRLRAQLVTELREDSDVRGRRVDQMPGQGPETSSCGCPIDEGLVRHRRATCTDPVVAKLGWYFEPKAPASHRDGAS